MIKLPGLIDVHVHLRDPGQIHKEDFYTGSSAALAGGFTTILDMPNNKEPITTFKRLQDKIKEAKKKTVCDIGFYAGSLGDNKDEFMAIEPYVFGLKLYLNKTTGNFIIDKKTLEKIFSFWKSNKPILIHGEEDILPGILSIVKRVGKKVHICHVSKKSELNLILKAKENGLPITCGVAPHHLFLTRKDVMKIGSFALMKPELGDQTDQDFLWNNLNMIDVIESDHAPHTIAEKKSANPPSGVPNLETTLPLLLTAVSQKRLTIEKVIQLCFENPKNIFNIPTDNNTYVMIDEKQKYEINNSSLKTKCGWSPFAGWKVKGKIMKVILHGKKAFDKEKIISRYGSGRILLS